MNISRNISLSRYNLLLSQYDTENNTSVLVQQ